MFYISAAVCVGGTSFFILFADGEPQDWVKPYMSDVTVEDETETTPTEQNENNVDSTHVISR